MCIVSCAFAKSIVVSQKVSEQYEGNVSQACERKMSHKNIEVVNHLKYFEVKRAGEVIASFDPVNIDRNSLYIWAELSPNGKMLMFSTSDQGVFIVNLKGNILYKLGKIARATNWWNNRYIVGMVDEDDGDNFTKSDLVMIDVKTGEYLCLIDFDTVMKGSLVYDYGDALRFGASTALEDETDLDKVGINFEFFKAFTEGFLLEMKPENDEKKFNKPISKTICRQSTTLYAIY